MLSKSDSEAAPNGNWSVSPERIVGHSEKAAKYSVLNDCSVKSASRQVDGKRAVVQVHGSSPVQGHYRLLTLHQSKRLHLGIGPFVAKNHRDFSDAELLCRLQT